MATALRCPRLFYFRYIEKVPEPEVSPEARIGKAVHAALEAVLLGTPVAEATQAARAGLPDDHEQARFDQLGTGIAPFTQRIGTFRRRHRVHRQLVEYRLAVREDMAPTQFYAGDAFYRGVVDAAYLYDDDLAVIDHKTGMRMPGTVMGDQLESYAVLAAASFQGAGRYWIGIHWVAARAVEWMKPIPAREVGERLIPNLLDNIEAAALAVDDGPRPNPGYQCDRCAYRTLCPASRDQRFEPVEYEEDDED